MTDFEWSSEDEEMWKYAFHKFFGRKEKKKPAARMVYQPETYDEAPKWLIEDYYSALSKNAERDDRRPYTMIQDLAALDQGGELVPEEVIKRDDLKKVYEFLKAADLSSVVGDTPATRAILYMVSATNKQGQTGRGDGDDSESRPRFGRGEDAGEVAEQLNEAWQKVSEMTDEEREEAADSDMSGQSYNEGDSRDQVTMKLVFATLNSKLTDMIDRVSRYMNQRAETTVVPETGYADDYNGKHIYIRDIKGPHELPYMTSAEKIMFLQHPDYANIRLSQGETQVAPRATRYSRKQVIVMGVDRSGSMMPRHPKNGFDPITVAVAIAANRAKHASEGRAEVFLYFWADQMGSMIRINKEHPMTPRKVMDTMKRARVGGGTHLNEAILIGIKRVKNVVKDNPGQYTSAPDLMIVTDGQASLGSAIALPETYEFEVDGKKYHTRLNVIHIGESDYGPLKYDPDDLDRIAITAKGNPEAAKKLISAQRGDASLILMLGAKLTGGDLWFVDVKTGEPIPIDKLVENPTLDMKYGAWRSWGWGKSKYKG